MTYPINKIEYEVAYEYLTVVMNYAKLNTVMTTPTREEFMQYVSRREQQLLENMKKQEDAQKLGDCQCQECKEYRDRRKKQEELDRQRKQDRIDKWNEKECDKIIAKQVEETAN
jgi:hypothetical protein